MFYYGTGSYFAISFYLLDYELFGKIYADLFYSVHVFYIVANIVLTLLQPYLRPRQKT